MKRGFWKRRTMLVAMSVMLLNGVVSFAQKREEMKFVNIDSLMLIGQGYENSTVKYGRVPEELRSELRPELVSLGSNSSGLAVRFSTNSSYVGVKWTVMHNMSMNHMPSTGIKGMDLYVLENGNWHYVGTAKPTGKENFAVFVKGMTRHNREYVAYLPLYDGVESVEIGVEPESQVRTPQNSRLVKSVEKKPLIFYGTSITQGGCASRPGMAYPSILGRMLDRETINLGFSGNGRLDFAMAKAINMTEAEVVVLDCLPNTTTQIIRDSAYNFIKHILDFRPGIPLIMIENPNFPSLIVDIETKTTLQEENKEWRELFAKLIGEGYNNVIYVRGDNLLGEDGETTVDGVHLTDLGFLRYAEALYPYFSQILGKE